MAGEWQCNTTVRGDASALASRMRQAVLELLGLVHFTFPRKLSGPLRIKRLHIKLEFLASENQGVATQVCLLENNQNQAGITPLGDP